MPTPYKQIVARYNDTLRRIQDSIYQPVAPLTVDAWVTPEPAPFHDRQSGAYHRFSEGDRWGGLFDCAWFHFTGKVPVEAAGEEVVLFIDLSGEACVVDQVGMPVVGLTTFNSGYDWSLGAPGKRVVRLFPKAVGGEDVDVWADAGNNDLFGAYKNNGTVVGAQIALFHPNLYALHYDFEVLNELMQQVPEDSARYACIREALYEAVRVLRGFTEEEAAVARTILAPELAKRGGDPSLRVTAVGHAHIDLAWLWPLRETKRKGARTFSTVLRMMERYPEYVFGASQPQLYQWMKDDHPALYAQIRERVAEGRWEPQGAMWVESDSNVPSGESLVRQVLLGKRFFRDEFGVDIDCLWQPDVFGYCGSLPQILLKAGVRYFMTQKLSWSEINRHPHNTFHWVGIDGSSVLAHMPPEDTYNSSAAPRAIAQAERNYRDKGVSTDCLVLYGIGDGGGGPGEEHLERLAREQDLAGLPPVVQEPSTKFFERLARNADRYAVWHGELYLERHQGTLTSQARNKWHNRKIEFLLRDLELSSVWAMLFAGYAYPSERLDAIWKEVLFFQFHDILPGSSITRVYEESLARYAHIATEVVALTADADRAWLAAVAPPGARQVVVNTLGWDRNEWVHVGAAWARASVPAFGFAVLDDAEVAFDAPVATAERLENEHLRVTFDSAGRLKSVFDKDNDRETLAEGGLGNVLAVYEDRGDAWDFAIDYDRFEPSEFALEQAEAWTDGPVGMVRHIRKYGESRLVQEIALASGSRRVEFRTEVDWRETHKMLRTSFPTSVVATSARFEIQFGNIERPTHMNTTWDMAMFEVCGHKWVDLSEQGYGVALLNDSKYGHQVREGVLDLNLLRSSTYPDPVADKAVHRFAYALYPHAGDYVEGGVVREAYAMNVPIRVLQMESNAKSPVTAPLQEGASFLAVDADNVVIDSVKKSEDGNDIIVRLYEAHGAAACAGIRLGFPSAKVDLVDLMEENPSLLPIAEGKVMLSFRPFEIHTLRIAL